jgi:phage baseplate assembly protein V
MHCSDNPHDTITDMIRYGTVVSVDGRRAVVQCGEVLSPPLQWLAIAGAWLVWLPPSEGAQVTVLCPDGDITGGIILNGLYSDAINSPVTSLLAALLKAPDDATFVYDAAVHALTVTLPAGGTATLIAPGGFTFEGDVTVTGDVAVQGDISAAGTIHADEDVTAEDISLKDHLHGQVQTGTAKTGAPE